MQVLLSSSRWNFRLFWVNIAISEKCLGFCKMAVEILLLGARNKGHARFVKASDSRVEWKRYLIFSTTLWQVQVQNTRVLNL